MNKQKIIEIQEQSKWTNLPGKKVIEKTIASLKANNMNAIFVENEDDAKRAVFDLIPKGSEVMTVSSVTIDSLGISDEIQKSGKYNSVKNKLMSMDRAKDGREMQRIGSAPEFVIGSVHAITQDGKVLIASNSGSQLPAYSYGSSKVIWVVGAQKVVKDLDEAMKRLYEHTLPLESERAKKAYGIPGSFVSKTLIFNREPAQDRINIVIVNKALGY